MANLILHIGWPKTGTTSLQRFCTANQSWLAGQGLIYHASRGDSVGDIARKLERGEDISAQAQVLAEHAAGQGDRTLIVSSEGLATNAPENVAAYIGRSWQVVTVVAYLRAQEDYLEGIYKQAQKWGAPLSLAYCLSGPVRRTAEYDRYLASWQRWCDASGARLMVRLYDPERKLGWDIRRDVFAALGYAAPEDLPPSDNVSPSRALLGLYAKLPPIQRLQQINREMVASGIAGATGSGDVLSGAQIAELRAEFAAGNEAVRRRYFPDRAELFPAPPPRQAASVDLDALKSRLVSVIRDKRGAEIAEAARQALALD